MWWGHDALARGAIPSVFRESRSGEIVATAVFTTKRCRHGSPFGSTGGCQRQCQHNDDSTEAPGEYFSANVTAEEEHLFANGKLGSAEPI